MREILVKLDHRRAGQRAASVVGPRNRRPPEGDDGIADELVDRPAMIENHLAHPVEIGVEEPRHHFRRDHAKAG